MLWLFIVVWPRTPWQRMISMPEPTGDFVWSDAAKAGNIQSLIGAEGVALNELLPSGLVQIGDQSYEAFSESGPIDLGKPIRVTRIDVGRLVVMAIRESKQSDAPMSEGSGLIVRSLN